METPTKKVPGQIRRLDESVVNRIAAGEIIQRPSNALKELLENALDAGATTISVVVKQGGLQLLQISDNGTGIRKEDLSVVCERFTTSKLKDFSDLTKIHTYGFRGEALASISHVAKLSILTKTQDEKCGFKCWYTDGKLIESPKPCAANQGTTIIVDDLFFNIPTRKRVLKSPSEEFQRIADVVSKYAIHNTGVGFSLKKTGDNGPQWAEGHKDIRTQNVSSLQQNIAAIYGTSIEKELVSFEVDNQNGPLNFKATGHVTGVNYNTKKAVSLIFINNRLVESPALKKAVDIVYSSYLPKGSHPFVYLSLEINPANVDVNVHPTKHEVHFLYQDEIVEKIQRALEAKLMSGSGSRIYRAQTVLPDAPLSLTDVLNMNKEESLKQPVGSKPLVAAKNMVRTDSKEQKLDKFVTFIKPTTPKMSLGHSFESNGSNKQVGVPLDMPYRMTAFPQDAVGDSEKKDVSTTDTDVFLTPKPIDIFTPKKSMIRRRTDIDRLGSIMRLRQKVQDECDISLRNLIFNHTFVGCVDREFALFQHETSLYVMSTPQMSELFFYQMVIHEFGNFSAIRLNPSAPIGVLAKLALDNTEESGWTEADGNKTELASHVVRILMEKRKMLDDYLSLEIDENGDLTTIPLLLEGYVPFLGNLPSFLLRLASEVDWKEEEACFHSLAKEIAKFYAISTDETSEYNSNQHQEDDSIGVNSTSSDNWMRVIEHTLYPAMKAKLLPIRSSANSIINVASLPDLYKVFERC